MTGWEILQIEKLNLNQGAYLMDTGVFDNLDVIYLDSHFVSIRLRRDLPLFKLSFEVSRDRRLFLSDLDAVTVFEVFQLQFYS